MLVRRRQLLALERDFAVVFQAVLRVPIDLPVAPLVECAWALFTAHPVRALAAQVPPTAAGASLVFADDGPERDCTG
jgi:hypothetical protein